MKIVTHTIKIITFNYVYYFELLEDTCYRKYIDIIVPLVLLNAG